MSKKIYSYVNFDWLDNKEMAILLYKQGVRELEKAVNLNIDPNGNLFNYLFLFIHM